MAYKTRRERRERGGKAVHEPLPDERGHQYNAQGSPEEKEETAKSDGFKHGGAPHKKRKRGGHVEGAMAKHHLGKRARGGAAHHGEHHKVEHELHKEHHEHHRARGGHVPEHEKEHEKKEHEREERARGGHVGHHKRARGGGAPFSSAHNLSAPGNDKKTGPGEDAEAIP
jgi:hypothetical protein